MINYPTLCIIRLIGGVRFQSMGV